MTSKINTTITQATTKPNKPPKNIGQKLKNSQEFPAIFHNFLIFYLVFTLEYTIGATFKMTACAPQLKIVAPMTSVMKWAYATILEKATTKVNTPPTAKPATVSFIPDFSLLIE